MEGMWGFPANNWGQRQGISESGIELFKGKPIQSLAREICQNSLDAGLNNEKAIVEFSLFEIASEFFPGRTEFQSALSSCLSTWKHQKSKKTVSFIENAMDIINSDSIRCLRISDYNTTGLRGSDQLKNTDWDDLIKAAGSSDKNVTAGGSFGIGKFAPFACSELRTVFYSTIDLDEKQATQGVARLVSFVHDEKTGEETMGVGYYGIPEKNRPINKLLRLDKNFKRVSSGTDIYVLGFIDVDEWIVNIIDEVLDGFLYAIYKDTLEIKVSNVVLNKETLPIVIEKYESKLSNATMAYYKVLTSEKSKWTTHNFRNMGDIRIGLLYGEEWFPRSVSMIRNPWMKIYDQKNISNSIPFAGVCIIEGDKLNEYLRKLENPQHTAWEVERLEKKIEINTAKIVLQDIRKLIKKEFENYLKEDGIEQVDIEGAGDLIPFEEQNQKEKPNQIDPLIKKVQQVKIKKQKSGFTKGTTQYEIKTEEVEELVNVGVIDAEEAEILGPDKGETSKDSNEKSREDSPKSENDKDNSKLPKMKKIDVVELKLMCIDYDNSVYRIAILSGKQYSECKLHINQLDDQGNREAIKVSDVKSADKNVSWKNNEIYNFKIEKAIIKHIDFSVDIDDYFSAEVTIYGIEE